MPKLKPETLTARRTRILKAALACFSTQGYYQTTVDDIAQEAGLSKGSIYVYFGSKKELLLTASDWFFDEFRLFGTGDVTGSTAYEKLVCALNGLVATITSEAFQAVAPVMVEVWIQDCHDPDFKKTAKDLYVKLGQSLGEIIQEGIESGEFRPVHAPTLASILLAVFDGLMVQAMADATAIDWASVSETLCTLVAGLLVET